MNLDPQDFLGRRNIARSAVIDDIEINDAEGRRLVRSSSIKPVLNALAGYADEKGVCWPKIFTLAQNTGFCQKTVKRVINALKMNEIISVKPRHFRPNFYIIDFWKLRSLVPTKGQASSSTSADANQSSSASNESSGLDRKLSGGTTIVTEYKEIPQKLLRDLQTEAESAGIKSLNLIESVLNMGGSPSEILKAIEKFKSLTKSNRELEFCEQLGQLRSKRQTPLSKKEKQKREDEFDRFERELLLRLVKPNGERVSRAFIQRRWNELRRKGISAEEAKKIFASDCKKYNYKINRGRKF